MSSKKDTPIKASEVWENIRNAISTTRTDFSPEMLRIQGLGGKKFPDLSVLPVMPPPPSHEEEAGPDPFNDIRLLAGDFIRYWNKKCNDGEKPDADDIGLQAIKFLQEKDMSLPPEERRYRTIAPNKPKNLRNRVASDIGRLLGIEKEFISSPLAVARGIKDDLRIAVPRKKSLGEGAGEVEEDAANSYKKRPVGRPRKDGLEPGSVKKDGADKKIVSEKGDAKKGKLTTKETKGKDEKAKKALLEGGLPAPISLYAVASITENKDILKGILPIITGMVAKKAGSMPDLAEAASRDDPFDDIRSLATDFIREWNRLYEAGENPNPDDIGRQAVLYLEKRQEGLKEDDPLRPYPKLSVTKPTNLKNRVASDIGRLLGIEKSFVSSPLALARGIQQEVRKGERKDYPEDDGSYVEKKTRGRKPLPEEERRKRKAAKDDEKEKKRAKKIVTMDDLRKYFLLRAFDLGPTEQQLYQKVYMLLLEGEKSVYTMLSDLFNSELVPSNLESKDAQDVILRRVKWLRDQGMLDNFAKKGEEEKEKTGEGKEEKKEEGKEEKKVEEKEEKKGEEN